MTTATRQQLISSAWSEYRRQSQALPRTLSWAEYLERDDRLWREYLAAERDAMTVKEAA